MEVQKITGPELQAYVENLVARSRIAQKSYERNCLTNRSADEVIRAIGMATCDHAEELCKEALAETQMGNLEDKMMKLTSACKIQWTVCKGQNTIEYEDCPGEPGVRQLPKPMGVIGAVMPSTNPVATIIGNAMMALKGRNSIIIAPHPASVHISVKMVGILRQALKAVGVAEDLIQCIGVEAASVEATTALLKLCDCNLATGGPGMVKAVYSSGKPGIGVGQGNTQEIIDRGLTEEDWESLIQQAIFTRTLDNGVPCTGTQTDHVPAELEEKYLKLMREHGAYVITDEEQRSKIRSAAFPEPGKGINRKIVGKLPPEVGRLAGIDIPEGTRVIVVKNQACGDQDDLCREILCPIMRYTTYDVFEDAVDRAVLNLEHEGAGHSSCIWSHNDAHIEYAAKRVPTCRFHINQPTGGGFNGLTMGITIGCGTWGGTSVPENVAYYHLLQKTKVTTLLPNMRPFTDPMADWDNFEPFNRLLN